MIKVYRFLKGLIPYGWAILLLATGLKFMTLFIQAISGIPISSTSVVMSFLICTSAIFAAFAEQLMKIDKLVNRKEQKRNEA